MERSRHTEWIENSSSKSASRNCRRPGCRADAPAGERLEARLKEPRIAPGAPVETFSTPRRLTARVAPIAERQDDLEETITGPPVSRGVRRGRAADAGRRWASRRSRAWPFDAARRASRRRKGEYLAFQKRSRGKSAVDALPDVLGGVLRDSAVPQADALGRAPWTTAGASCCSGGRSAGCCSCMAAGSCRSRSGGRQCRRARGCRTSRRAR